MAEAPTNPILTRTRQVEQLAENLHSWACCGTHGTDPCTWAMTSWDAPDYDIRRIYFNKADHLYHVCGGLEKALTFLESYRTLDPVGLLDLIRQKL